MFIGLADRNKEVLVTLIEKKKNNRPINDVTFWLSAALNRQKARELGGYYSEESSEEDANEQKEPKVEQTPLHKLLAYISMVYGDSLFEGDPIQTGEITFTDEGKTWCKKVFVDGKVYENAGLDPSPESPHRNLPSLNTKQLDDLLESLKAYQSL